MSESPAIAKWRARAAAVQSLLCIGLDSALEALPPHFRDDPSPQFSFNRWIIEQTQPYASAYKPNLAFYEARGAAGWAELQQTLDYLRQQHPDIFIICDAKRADIGNTNQGYVQAIFDELGADAITLHPYLGQEALRPFLARRDKCCILLCRTSNPGAGEVQDLSVEGRPLWEVLARKAAQEWNQHGNLMLVVGATYPDELRQVRGIVGEMPLLVPGIGAQGGEIAPVLAAGGDSAGGGLLLSASRSIIFADDPAAAARHYRDEINQSRR